MNICNALEFDALLVFYTDFFPCFRIFGTDVGYRKLKALKSREFEDSYEQKKQ